MDPNSKQSEKMTDLALLWGKASTPVSAYVRSVVPNYHDAEDIIQATVSHIAHHFDEYDPERPFVAWAIGIARYRIMESRHQNQRKPLLLGDEALDKLSGAMIAEAEQIEHRLEALDHCIGRLNPKHQQVLEQRYQGQKSHKVIAQSIGIKEKSVSILLWRIRQILADCVTQRIGEQS